MYIISIFWKGPAHSKHVLQHTTQPLETSFSVESMKWPQNPFTATCNLRGDAQGALISFLHLPNLGYIECLNLSLDIQDSSPFS